MTPSASTANRSTLIALLVAVTFFMENLDATVIATALPDIARSFGVAAIDLNIGMSAYLLAIAVFIPISGWLADRFGSRQVFGSAIVIFTVASLAYGLSTSLEAFVAARVLQGIGGAMMVPVGRLAVLRVTEKQDMVRAISYITWPGLVSPILGPPLGGFIVTHATWPWIFYLNLPLGVLAFIAAMVLVPSFREAKPRRFDLPGFLLVGGACSAILYGLELLGRSDHGYAPGAALSAAGVVLAVLACRHMRARSEPLMALGVLNIPTYSVALLGGSAFRITTSTLPFLLPLMFQLGFGLSAFAAGSLVLAVFAGNLAMKPFTTPIMERFGFRTVLLVNGAIGVVTMGACAWLDPNISRTMILFVLFAGGLSRSMQFSAFNSVGFADVPKAQMSDASTLFSMFFQLSMGLGVALGALMLRGAMVLHSNAGEAATADFQLVFIWVAGIGVLAMLDTLRLQPGAGASVLKSK